MVCNYSLRQIITECWLVCTYTSYVAASEAPPLSFVRASHCPIIFPHFRIWSEEETADGAGAGADAPRTPRRRPRRYGSESD